MELQISVSEAIEVFKVIQARPEGLFEMMRVEIRESIGQYLSELMKVELSQLLGREPYERGEGEVNHRNGTYPRRFTLKGIGQVAVDVPRDRQGKFNTRIIPRSKQYENELRQDLCLMFLVGVSTRTLAMISERLIGRKISPAEVSNANKELIDAVEEWRTRDLSLEPIKYLFVDGVCFPMRVSGSIERVPVLAAIGITEFGQRLVLGLQAGDKESASSWRQFFKDLKARGLNGQSVILGIMDGLAGLEKVFHEEFPKAKVQRCQVHLASNVIAKVPMKLRQSVADDMRSIFYASSKSKAMEFFESFKQRWGKEVPSAVKCLTKSIGPALTFLNFPEDEWISLRTTNIIERLNKEFKRRTKSMEIVAGETACYTLLAFISLKMEIHWRSNPIGKVRTNLPLLRKLADDNFTQKS